MFRLIIVEGTSSAGGQVERDPQNEVTNVDVEFLLQFVLACLFLFPPSINFNQSHTSELDSNFTNLEDIKNKDIFCLNDLNSYKQPRSPLNFLHIIYNIPLLYSYRKVNSCRNIYDEQSISQRNLDTGQQQLIWNLPHTCTKATDWKFGTMKLRTIYGCLLHCMGQARDDEGACY